MIAKELLFISTLYLLTSTTSADKCPDVCHCNVELTGDFVEKWECQTPPTELPRSVTYLKLTKLSTDGIFSIDTLFTFHSLQILNLSGLAIENITSSDSQSTTSLSNLQVLDLSRNKIRRLNADVLFRFPNLTVLDLSDNGLKDIKTSTFEKLQSLRVLNLANNHLVNLTFTLPTSILGLDISNNELEDLASIPSHLQSLRSLNLCGNEYQSVTKPFPKFPELVKLCLGDSIRTFTPSALANLAKLTDLKVSGKCTLNETIQSELGNLATLRVLQISDFQLPSISKNMFATLSNLFELHLIDTTTLAGFDNESLSNLKHIRVLNLHHSSFLAHSFLGLVSQMQLTSLQELWISKTNISTIDSRSLESLPNLELVDISDNPLDCDADMKDLADLVQKRQVRLKSPMETVCAMPQSLTGQQLTDCHVLQQVANPQGSRSNSSMVYDKDEGIYYYLNRWGITTDHILYLTLALAILVCLLTITIILVASCRCGRRRFSNPPAGSSESFALRADSEYSFDNFTHVDLVQRSPVPPANGARRKRSKL